MRLPFAICLSLLSLWGVYVSSTHISVKHPWCLRRWLTLLIIAVLLSGSITSSVTLLTRSFAPWMFVPIGVSYILMLPLPCFFPWITDTRGRRLVRNAIFIFVAAFFLLFGFGAIPVSIIGL